MPIRFLAYLLLWVTDWMSANEFPSSEGEPFIESAKEDVEEWLLTYGLVPLFIETCGNECGCITLHTQGMKVARTYWTSDMTSPYEPRS